MSTCPIQHLPSTDALFFGLGEWIFDLFATVEGRDENKEGAASNNQAEGSGGFVAGIV